MRKTQRTLMRERMRLGDIPNGIYYYHGLGRDVNDLVNGPIEDSIWSDDNMIEILLKYTKKLKDDHKLVLVNNNMIFIVDKYLTVRYCGESNLIKLKEIANEIQIIGG